MSFIIGRKPVEEVAPAVVGEVIEKKEVPAEVPVEDVVEESKPVKKPRASKKTTRGGK